MGQIDRNNVPTLHVEPGEREGEKECLMIEGQACHRGRGRGWGGEGAAEYEFKTRYFRSHNMSSF